MRKLCVLVLLVGCGGGGGSGDDLGDDVAPIDGAVAPDAAPPGPCDTGLAIDDADATHAAQALGLCDGSLTSAAYVRADGTAATVSLQDGLLGDFGNLTPQEGDRMLVLSTGHARDAGDGGACNNSSCNGAGAGTAPAGFPQDVPGCTVGSNIADDTALELHLHTPADATGFSIDIAFYTFEYPAFACSTDTDELVAIVTPAPSGAINGNIAFDANLTPVSSNLDMTSCTGCTGTGFDVWGESGTSGWLRATAPVAADADVTIRLAIWDSLDGTLDSTAVLDHFQWLTAGAPTVSMSPL